MKKFIIICMIVLVDLSVVIGWIEKHGYTRMDLVRHKKMHNEILGENDIVKPAPTPRTNDSISLKRYLDNEYYAEIIIGHKGQKMNVGFDTTWAETWVLSKRCQILETPGCKNHNLYDYSKSSYYKPDGRPYIGNEGTYNFTGIFSYENISFAHSNVTNFSFVEMITVPDSYMNEKADGVIGLGLKGSGNYEPFFYALYRQKKIKNNLFSIFLNRDKQSKKGGSIMLGYINDKHIHKTQTSDGKLVPDTIKYLDVLPGVYWMFNMDKIVVTSDKQKVNHTLCPNGCKAIVDSSSNAILGPPADIQYLRDQMQAIKYGDQWLVNCDTVNKLPKINFVLDGQYFRIGGPQYIIQATNQTSTVCIVSFQTSASPSVEDLWVLGGAFLGQYYSIYNIDERKIGFVRIP